MGENEYPTHCAFSSSPGETVARATQAVAAEDPVHAPSRLSPSFLLPFSRAGQPDLPDPNAFTHDTPASAPPHTSFPKGHSHALDSSSVQELSPLSTSGTPHRSLYLAREFFWAVVRRSASQRRSLQQGQLFVHPLSLSLNSVISRTAADPPALALPLNSTAQRPNLSHVTTLFSAFDVPHQPVARDEATGDYTLEPCPAGPCSWLLSSQHLVRPVYAGRAEGIAALTCNPASTTSCLRPPHVLLLTNLSRHILPRTYNIPRRSRLHSTAAIDAPSSSQGNLLRPPLRDDTSSSSRESVPRPRRKET